MTDSTTAAQPANVVLYSGGMDSYTLLQKVLHENSRGDPDRVVALSIFYGQRHSKELAVADQVCRQLGIAQRKVSLGELSSLFRSSLTGHSDVPEGHYADESMKQTIVPNRNLLMLSLATGYAHSIGASRVFYGAHFGDRTIYPDCRPEFLSAFNRVLRESLGVEECPYVEMPFSMIEKEGIISIGMRLRDHAAPDFDYADTWTCYKGLPKPCGKCGACVERAEAFAKVSMEDPLLSLYEVGQ